MAKLGVAFDQLRVICSKGPKPAIQVPFHLLSEFLDVSDLVILLRVAVGEICELCCCVLIELVTHFFEVKAGINTRRLCEH